MSCSESAEPGFTRFVIAAGEAGLRLDQVLAAHTPGITRSQLKNRLVSLCCNGKAVKPSFLAEEGDEIRFELEALVPLDLIAQNIPLDIVYEDDHVVVINKQAGLVVHPGAGNPDSTVVNGLLFRYPALGSRFSGTAGVLDQDTDTETGSADETVAEACRPGIVHRLDKDTSGIMVAALDPDSHAFMSAQFQQRTTRKWYLAVATGVIPQDELRVEGFICRDPSNRQCFKWDPSHGKAADSTFRILARSRNHTLLLVSPHTGRTHQIRVHAKHLGYPLLGDPLYGRHTAQDEATRLMLHALALKICIPGHIEAQVFRADPPPDMMEIIKKNGLTFDFSSLILD